MQCVISKVTEVIKNSGVKVHLPPKWSGSLKVQKIKPMSSTPQLSSVLSSIPSVPMQLCFSCVDREQQQDGGQQTRVTQGWREIHAAVALTDLAQGQSCMAGHNSVTLPGAGTGQSSARQPFSITRTTIIDRMCVRGPTSALRQSCTMGPTLANRIIQKSSHISEVQTVNVALASSV